ncbi:MAG: hypothetical protein KGJ41_04275 [Rhodospirillales bacterium]|nr:hypothetical protein [Rhodospirillales bacterium]MDE2198218.1 hypothetical protein [Rhodospirillales bacterium]MDE2574980.1 hypothetical protein [Rhodospirillales bacterium]
MADPIDAGLDFSAISNVAPAYVHRDKHITAAPLLVLANAYLKWYDVAEAGLPVSPALRAAARGFLEAEAASHRLDIARQLGFVVLHRCSADFCFLLAATWRKENEVWETIYAVHGAAAPVFAPFDQPGPHRGTFCVWELGVVCHEQQAWRRYLASPRGDAEKQRYLRDIRQGVA